MTSRVDVFLKKKDEDMVAAAGGREQLPRACLRVHSSNTFKTFRSSKLYDSQNHLRYATSVTLRADRREGLDQFDDTVINALTRSLKQTCESCHSRLENFMAYTCRHDEFMRMHRTYQMHPPRLLYFRFLIDDERRPCVQIRFAYGRRDKLQMLRTLIVKSVFQYAVDANARLRRHLVNSRHRYIALTVSDTAVVTNHYVEGLQKRMCRLNKADRLGSMSDATASYTLRHAHEKEGALMTNLECSVCARRGDLDGLKYAHEHRAMSREAPMDRRTCVYAAASSSSSSSSCSVDRALGDAAGCLDYIYRNGGGGRGDHGGCWSPTAAIKAAVWCVIDHDSSLSVVKRVVAIEQERHGSRFDLDMRRWYGPGAEDCYLNARSDEEVECATRNTEYGCSSTNELKRTMGSMASYYSAGMYRHRDRAPHRPPWTLTSEGACCVMRAMGRLACAYTLFRSPPTAKKRRRERDGCGCMLAFFQSPSPQLTCCLFRDHPVSVLIKYISRVEWHREVWLKLRDAIIDSDGTRTNLLLLRFYIRVWRRRIVRRACVTIQRAWIHHHYCPGGGGYTRQLIEWNGSCKK